MIKLNGPRHIWVINLTEFLGNSLAAIKTHTILRENAHDFLFNQYLTLFPEKQIANMKQYRFWYLPLGFWYYPLHALWLQKLGVATSVHEVLTGKTWNINDYRRG